jgi:hypothetical protein
MKLPASEPIKLPDRRELPTPEDATRELLDALPRSLGTTLTAVRRNPDVVPAGLEPAENARPRGSGRR